VLRGRGVGLAEFRTFSIAIVPAALRCSRATLWQKFVSTRNPFITVSVRSSKLANENSFAIGPPGCGKTNNFAGALNG
jgi:hypothetical protein